VRRLDALVLGHTAAARMKLRRHHVRTAIALVALLLAAPVVPVNASDHADPVDILNRQRLEGGITDLFVFPRTDERGVRRMEVILCVRRALRDASTLRLTPYTYTVNFDLRSTLTFDDEQQLKRYGGTVVRPQDISPTATISMRLDDKAGFAGRPVFTGLRGDLADNTRIKVASGVFDDPFIFPTFFGTNIVGMIVSIPLDAFENPEQQNWIIWATSSRDGKQIDHVGRSLRTQNPRFDMLNTLPPSRHVAAIQYERDHPSFMRDILLRLGFQAPYAFRQWDFVPDVMIYSRRSPVGFPNGRLLTDDVAERLATYGDTLLKEISYITGSWPRAVKNDVDFRLRDQNCAAAQGRGVAAEPRPSCDQSVPENLEFPYLGARWPEKMERPPVMLSEASQMKLWAIAVGATALWLLSSWVFAIVYHRRKLRRRFM
jgi:hypothetical protein